ncbi:MAG: flagellar motor protein MotB [Rhodocyclaceae bacterium]|jgi:chemotaxis protein MotB|nr:flagellar motor protein MotB [Rhodocyclaceae bacterium]
MSDDTQQPIVVKKIKKGGGGAHGGAWKIAYADFVTAMMAFFLLMWLLGSTAQGDLKGIADYFTNPVKVSLSGGSGAGDATSIIQGGGMDLTSTFGQKKRAENETNKKPTLKQMKDAFEKSEKEMLAGLKASMEAIIEATPSLAPFKNQLLLDLTTEGLRIQIVDEKSRPMFDSASSELKPYTKDILRNIGAILNKVENRISLSGHTDAQPYAGGAFGFGNWELSTNRANASRRELVAGGLDGEKVMRVVGLSSTVLFAPDDPYSAVNRRISIVVLNKRTEEAIMADGRSTEITESTDVTPEMLQEGGAQAPAAKP